MLIPSTVGKKTTSSDGVISVSITRLKSSLKCVISDGVSELVILSPKVEGLEDLLRQFIDAKDPNFRGPKYRSVLTLLSTGVLDGIS